MRNLRSIAVAASALCIFGASSGVAQAAGTLDQSSTTVQNANGVIIGNEYAQIVTAGISGTLSSVDISALRVAGTAQDLTVSIRAVSGGQPSGSDLATASVPASSVGVGNAWISFVFASPIAVSVGQQFAIVVTTTETAVYPYRWTYEFTSSYSGGASATKTGGGAWTNQAFGFNFKTYVTISESGPTPPPVLQQFGMPESGTCDAAAPIVLNWGGAGSGGWGTSWAQWMNGGNGGAVCTRTLVYSNALGYWAVG
jgi:hypothetical protein